MNLHTTIQEISFTAIDFETANEKRSSPCSLGIVVVKNGVVAHEQHLLIRPREMRFTDINKRIHGIDEQQVSDAPEFNEVWESIQHHICHSLVLAHNSEFDISVLRQTLELYNISVPEFRSMCTLRLARQAFIGLASYRLSDVAEHIGFTLEHHQALSDAKAAAMIGIKALPLIDPSLYYYGHEELAYHTVKKSAEEQKDSFGYAGKYIASDLLKPNLSAADANNPFYNKKVVFTGDLQTISRKDAAARIQAMGADIDTAISRKTQLVILGQKAGPMKLKKIEELKAQGCMISVVEEAEFLKMINRDNKKYYGTES